VAQALGFVVLQHLDFFSACDEFPGGLCLVGQVENLRAGWQPALFSDAPNCSISLPPRQQHHAMFGCGLLLRGAAWQAAG